MRYKVWLAPRRAAWFITAGDTVVWTSPALRWAVGRPVDTVEGWCAHHGMRITLQGGQHRPCLTRQEARYLRAVIHTVTIL